MNQQNKEPKNNRNSISLIALLLFLTSGYFLYLAWQQGQPPPGTSLTPTDQVNFNLQKTLQRQELDQLRLQQEHFSKFKTRDPRPVQKNLEDDSLSFEYDRTHEKIAEDLESQIPRENLTSVDDVVQTQLFNDFMVREQNEKARQEYARKFVENARRAGIEVKLTPDLRIRSVRRMSSTAPPRTTDVKSGTGAAQ